MDCEEILGLPNQINPGELPSILNNTSLRSGVVDNAEGSNGLHKLSLDGNSREPKSITVKEIEVITMEKTSATTTQNSPVRSSGPNAPHPVSLGMPASPSRLQTEGAKRVMFSNEIFVNGQPTISVDGSATNSRKQNIDSVSQPLPQDNLEGKTKDAKGLGSLNSQQQSPRNNVLRNRRFDSFKTRSRKLERQLSSLRGIMEESDKDGDSSQEIGSEPLQAHRYFDALEGPELDTLKESEVSMLPEDKTWPFLLRFPVSAFGICLGVSSQAILWKTLATSPSAKFLHISRFVNVVLWFIAVVLVVTVSSIYMSKIILYFEAVRREYYHPVRVNFFFAPWVACLFLALGVPPVIAENIPSSLWYVLMVPIFCLEVKIYGQWMSGGQRRLSKVANPSNHLSIVGNFVGALLGASIGLKEGPIFFFAVGLAHYTVLFVTLYQRLPTNETLPKDLHPVFFLFVAGPSVACTAWANISGSFDNVSRIAYFVALFLYLSLVRATPVVISWLSSHLTLRFGVLLPVCMDQAVRVNFFRGFKFSLAWWAYTFPMTGAAIATIAYAGEVRHTVTKVMTVVLSAISTVTVLALLVTTVLHAFVKRDLFPNDVSIAITETKHNHFWSGIGSGTRISEFAALRTTKYNYDEDASSD